MHDPNQPHDPQESHHAGDSHAFDQETLDAMLRDVAAPGRLRERLRAIAEPTDDNLDAWLAAVATPPAVLKRCRAIPEDEGVEGVLRDHEAPADLLAGLRRIPNDGRRWPAVVGHAAVWLLAIGGVVNLAWQGVDRGREQAGRRPSTAGAGATLEPWADLATNDEEASQIELTTETALDVSRSVGDAAYAASPVEPPRIVPGRFEEPARISPEWYWSEPRPSGRAAWATHDGPNALEMLRHRYGLEGRSRAPVLTASAAGSSGGASSLFRATPYRPGGAGRAPALHDEIVLASSPEWAAVEIPVVGRAVHFDYVRECLLDGHWPHGASIRKEEFLAAMRYGFAPAPIGQVGLHLAGGPPVFARNGATLLQVGVKAGGSSDGSSFGRSAVGDLVVKVRFHPTSVRAYRLIGYESVSTELAYSAASGGLRAGGLRAGGLRAGGLRAGGLRAGEERVLLFEAWLKPGVQTALADLEATWYDEAAGRWRKARGQLLRAHVAPTVVSSAPSLQVAAAAAEVAEILQTPPDDAPHFGLRAFRERQRHRHNRLMQNDDFLELLKMVEMAGRLRPELLGK